MKNLTVTKYAVAGPHNLTICQHVFNSDGAVLTHNIDGDQRAVIDAEHAEGYLDSLDQFEGLKELFADVQTNSKPVVSVKSKAKVAGKR
jgi:lipoate synthase